MANHNYTAFTVRDPNIPYACISNWVESASPFTVLSKSQCATKHSACVSINRWSLIPGLGNVWQTPYLDSISKLWQDVKQKHNGEDHIFHALSMKTIGPKVYGQDMKYEFEGERVTGVHLDVHMNMDLNWADNTNTAGVIQSSSPQDTQFLWGKATYRYWVSEHLLPSCKQTIWFGKKKKLNSSYITFQLIIAVSLCCIFPVG